MSATYEVEQNCLTPGTKRKLKGLTLIFSLWSVAWGFFQLDYLDIRVILALSLKSHQSDFWFVGKIGDRSCIALRKLCSLPDR